MYNIDIEMFKYIKIKPFTNQVPHVGEARSMSVEALEVSVFCKELNITLNYIIIVIHYTITSIIMMLIYSALCKFSSSTSLHSVEQFQLNYKNAKSN